MKKTPTRPDAIDYALALAEGVERVARMARDAARMPGGTRKQEAAREAAFALAERALAALERTAARGPR